MLNKSVFTISLDFELFWGVRDNRSLGKYGRNIREVHKVVPLLLDFFKKYDVHCTWAIVGFLFNKDKAELLANLPLKTPGYINNKLDPYHYIREHELDPLFHFAPELILKIAQYPGQEIATHTYSHFYTLEEGVTPASFREDLKMAVLISEKAGNKIKSIVFPRNQYNDAMLEECKAVGIKVYRGNERSIIYKSRNRNNETKLRRLARLVDSYLNITGYHTFKVNNGLNGCMNVPASRFLRPYNPRLAIFDPLKIRRITRGMDHAAKKKEIFHLWWHPHNFGSYTEKNFKILNKILLHFKKLKDTNKMESLNMSEICRIEGYELE